MQPARSPHNPIIEPHQIPPSRPDFEVIGVFNAAATTYQDQTILLLRVAERPRNNSPDSVLTATYDPDSDQTIIHRFPKDNPDLDFSDPRLIITPQQTYLTSISHLRLARSRDGIHFDIDPTPSLGPANPYETFGLEDPRITRIDETFYITYVAVSPYGVTTCLAATTDFQTFERLGVIFHPENKDVVLFPENIAGKYYALHRPTSPLCKTHDIWIAESPDLRCWGNHRFLISPRPGRWDALKIGPGAPPVKTPAGWLEIYHGVDDHNRYCLGALLLDLHQPGRIIAQSNHPILEPAAPYETTGFFADVVFTCGLISDDDLLKIYYGAADTSICYAEIPLQQILHSLEL